MLIYVKRDLIIFLLTIFNHYRQINIFILGKNYSKSKPKWYEQSSILKGIEKKEAKKPV